MTDREKLRQLNEGWEPPLELQRTRPRAVRLTAAGRGLAVLAAVLVAGGAFLGTLLYRQRAGEVARDRLLASAASRATARVVRLWRTGGKNDRCRATYEFAAGATRVIRNATLPCSAWRRLAEGQPLPVVFIEGQPQISRLEGIEPAGVMPVVVPFVPGVLLPLFGALVGWDLARQRRLLEEGRSAPAVVTKLGFRTDKGRKVYYQFLTYSGALAEGSYGPVHKSKQPNIGDRLTVIYDGESPRRNKRYPLQVVEIDL